MLLETTAFKAVIRQHSRDVILIRFSFIARIMKCSYKPRPRLAHFPRAFFILCIRGMALQDLYTAEIVHDVYSCKDNHAIEKMFIRVQESSHQVRLHRIPQMEKAHYHRYMNIRHNRVSHN